MLKKALLHPPCPRLAKTRPFPGFVLTRPDVPPTGKELVSASVGREGEIVRLGISLATAAVGKGTSWRAAVGRVVKDDLFEHPALIRV